MRVLFTCGREPAYQRNIVLRTCLERNFDVQSVTDSTPQLPLRYARLALKLLSTRTEHDMTCVGFLGQPLMPFVRRLTRKPILFDAFLSVYDTLCFDRRRFQPRSAVGQLAFWLDRTSCSQADLVLLDTEAHAQYFSRTFGLPSTRFRRLFVGCDESVFFPRPFQESHPLVLFYGTFLPLHGIDIVIRAAKLLEAATDIRFRVIGTGMEHERIRRLSTELDVHNVEFRAPVPIARLADEIAEATICLGGHFSAIEKAKRVIAGKTFQSLAMGKPTIVGDNPANRELLTPGHDAWFCQMADPEALASAILSLVQNRDLQTHLGQNALRTFRMYASGDALSRQVGQMANELMRAPHE
jgi:glycosyltransferase involved in cell wall biosynthesis